MNTPRGFVLILSAPSGAGKSTLCQKLRTSYPDLCLSISTTTRSPRPAELPGVDYFFVDSDTFRQKIQEDAFLEWAAVFGNYYGTSRAFVEPLLANGKIVLLDIDWQGARQVRSRLAVTDVVSIFLLPPSRAALEERLHRRAQDKPHIIAQRMAEAADTVSHSHEFDYVVVNEDLGTALNNLLDILQAEQLRHHRLPQAVQNILSGFNDEKLLSFPNK